jgi:hypothetical protein
MERRKLSDLVVEAEMSLGETPWVDRSYRALREALLRRVPADWLPRTITQKETRGTVGFDPPRPFVEVKVFKKPVIEEYGCGSYGCVAPTHKQGLVFKITSDTSEAAFVSRARTLPETLGIVQYKAIYVTDLTHRGRPVFVLWRSEAYSVGDWTKGFLQRHGSDDYSRQTVREAYALLHSFMQWAKEVAEYVRPRLRALKRQYDDAEAAQRRALLLTELWKAYEREDPIQVQESVRYAQSLRGVRRIGMALRTCLYIAQELSSNALLYRVGTALQHYLEEGILLADVHGNNIGLDHENEAIITDPGHAVEFHPRWAQPPSVERLEG